jgi:hypothetical protein
MKARYVLKRSILGNRRGKKETGLVFSMLRDGPDPLKQVIFSLTNNVDGIQAR